MTTENLDKVKSQAKNLTKDFPRSPRETIAGYVLAARALDKCRAHLAGTAGEYHFDCPLDNMFFSFAELKGADFKQFVASGASDDEVAQWIEKNAKKRERIEIIKWNNQLRDRRLSESPDKIQEHMEDYVVKNLPKNKPVYHFFDIFDIEEKRI